jgi:biopolymer transport protein ExbB/TolQ
MCDWLFWPFVVLTAVGLALLIFRALAEHQQKARGRRLLLYPIEFAGLAQFIKHLNFSKPCRTSQLFSQMIATFNKTKRAELLHEDVGHFLRGEKDSFEAFNRVIVFLSNTAGALGLLGTVWGIFETFHAGNVAGKFILRSMSAAFVMTMVGLVISITLNLGATWLHTLFSRHLRILSDRAEELRQAMLHLQVKSSSSPVAQRSPAPGSRPAAGSHREKDAYPMGVEDEVEEWA